MSGNYDVYMCRNEARDAVEKIANALNKENYDEVRKITEQIRMRGGSVVMQFVNELNRTYLIKNRMALSGIAKILNGKFCAVKSHPKVAIPITA